MTARPGRTAGGRELVACLVAGLAGGGLVLFGAGRPWNAPDSGALVTGDVNPVGSLLSSLGAVLLLGTIVVAVTRSAGRRLSGVITAATGLTATVVTATAAGGWTGWRLGVLAGAVLAAAAGLLAAARGPRWAGMSRRYDAPAAPRPPHESDPWRALDRGEDPTL
jgi:hypothetical protein